MLHHTYRSGLSRVLIQRRSCSDMLAFDDGEDEFRWNDRTLRDLICKTTIDKDKIIQYAWDYPKKLLNAPKDWLSIERVQEESANVVFHTNDSKVQLYYEAVPVEGDFLPNFSPAKEFVVSLTDGSPSTVYQHGPNCYILSYGTQLAVSSAVYFKDTSMVVAVLFSFPKDTASDDPVVAIGSSCVTDFAASAA